MDQQLYSVEHIDACLHFVRLDITPNDDAPQWWPCFLFQNMVELEAVARQLNIVQDTISKREIVVLYTQHLLQTANCKVALLLGDRPPVRCIFDVTPGSLIAEPFLEKLFQFNMRYRNHADYMQALTTAVPYMEAVVALGKTPHDGTDKAPQEANPTLHLILTGRLLSMRQLRSKYRRLVRGRL
jgi:hypothetical protein